MRKLFGPTLRIGLSPTSITLLRVGRRWRARTESLLSESHLPEQGAMSPEQLAIRLRTALADAQCAAMRTHVVLADDLVRYFTVTPPRNAGSLHDCRAAAAMRFQSLYGDAAADWRIDADWHAREPFVACAIPARWLAALQTVLDEKRLTLVALTSQFIAAWNRRHARLRDDAWFGVVHGTGVTVGAIQSGRLRAVRMLHSPQDDAQDLSWLPNRLAREALLLQLSAPAHLQLAGTLPAGWNPESLGTLACEPVDDAAATPQSAGMALARTGMRA